MKETLISIIVPCYNIEQYLPQCIESIINQTYNNWELILADDGSSDNSSRICDEYAAKDNRIKVIHKENGGVSSARNAALEIAEGKWITFIDSDDWFEPGAFNIFIDTIGKNECDRYIFNRYVVNGRMKSPVNPVDAKNIFRQNDELKWFLLDMINPDYDSMINKVHVSGIRGVNCNLYKATTILDNGIKFDETMRIAEDAMFNYDVMLHSHSAMLCYEVVGNYRVSDESVMHKFTPNILNINNTTLEAIYRRIGRLISEDKDCRRVYVNAVAEILFRAMKLYFVHPENKRSYSEKKDELERWLSNGLIGKAFDVAEMEYIPRGKKEIFKALKNGNYQLGG